MAMKIVIRPHFLTVIVFIVMSGYPVVQANDGFVNNRVDLLKSLTVYPPWKNIFESPTKDDQGSRPCPCDDLRWCEPIQKKYDKEVFIFSRENNRQNWLNYDWNKITTIVLFAYVNHDLICHAHKHGARAVTLGLFPVANLTNATQRSTWAKATVKFVQDNFMDGVNFDIESAIAKNDTARVKGLTALVAETATILKSVNPHAQVSFDLLAYPHCFGGRGRCYDVPSISKFLDVIFLMEYDQNNGLIAGSNSNLTIIVDGLKQYFDLGIKADKLILGLPWYGYSYECRSFTKEKWCHIAHVPFQGEHLSNSRVHPLDYRELLPMVDKSITGRLWEKRSLSPYFNYQDQTTGNIHQVWYDDPVSLKMKYDYAVKAGLRGVGMWEADALDYTDTALGIDQRVAMWAVIPEYKSKGHVMNRKGGSIWSDNRMLWKSKDELMSSSKDKL